MQSVSITMPSADGKKKNKIKKANIELLPGSTCNAYDKLVDLKFSNASR